MSNFRNLHRSILALFVVVVISIVILAHFSVSKIVAEQSRAHQRSISPAHALIVEHLMQPLHIAQTLSKSQEIKSLMQADDIDEAAIYNTLSRLNQEFGFLFFIASEKNRQQYYSDRTTHTLKEGEVSWYFKYKDVPDSAIADIGKWEDTHFYIDIKIFDDDGRFLGFFGTGKSLQSFIELFSLYKAEYGYDFIFTDQQRNIMLSSDPLLNARNSTFTNLENLPWFQDLKADNEAIHSLNNTLVKVDGHDYLIAEVNIAPFNWTLHLLTPLQARQVEISQGFIFSIVTLLVIIFVMFMVIYHLLYFFKQDMHKNMQMDPLTQLPNRAKVELRFGELQEQHVPMSCLLVDLDHFKSINDTYGHNTGDQVLVKAAEVLQNSIGEDDIVGRWGGEEFVILLPNTDPNRAYEVAQALRQNVANMNLHSDKFMMKVTASVGVSYSHAPNSLKELIASADDALYQAKRDGRNLVRVQLFDAA
ncbi:sensor domain-containing diguanylate cyclase [Aestuariibacter sp. AA17]|uniref:diguanylate cyclase n=1 Tax=Fluctibacter corallii TaxID=2984329 RepID=A0ABT3ABQ8_9ALTE|nr:sensor domain-containing diguanylate cyclase [Aestuariibacter sp. AA17]MCV2885697.1 sensor domain-containing diguanylate cyclase [Aestuariibacter sp. AA17]